MAPKRKCAPAMQAPQFKNPVPKQGGGGSLMDQLEKSEVVAPQSASAAKKLRSFEQKIAKIIRDNFPGWPAYLIDVVVRDTLTLRARITRDKKLVAEGQADITMGKFYYQELRELYDEREPPESLLPVADASEAKDERLESALLAWLNKLSNTRLLIEWAESAQSLNQKNCVALFRQLMRCYPGQNMTLATMTTEIMRMLVRLNVLDRLSKEVKVLDQHWDHACMKTLSNFKSHQRTTGQWWENAADYACMVVDKVKVEKILACKDSWSTVEQDLTDVVNSSGTGKMMFAGALREHRVFKLEAMVKRKIAEWVGKALTATLVAETREAFLAEWKDLGGEDWDGVTKRVATVSYRGENVKLPTSSSMDMFNVHAEGFIRGEARNHEKVPAMWCEDEIVPDTTKKCPSIEDGLTTKCKTAREGVIDFVTDCSSKGILAGLQKRSKFMLQADRMSKIEIAFWNQFVGEQSSARVVDAILRQLPDTSRELTMSQSKALLTTLKSGKLATLCGQSASAMITTVIDMMDTLLVGGAPDFKKVQGTSLETKLPVAMARFCVVVQKAQKGKPETKEYGEIAMNLHFEILKAREDDQEARKPTFAELLMFRQFPWLMTDEMRAQIKVWSEEALKAAGQASGAASASSSGAASSSAPPKKKAKKTASKEDTNAMVAKLFQ